MILLGSSSSSFAGQHTGASPGGLVSKQPRRAPGISRGGIGPRPLSPAPAVGGLEGRLELEAGGNAEKLQPQRRKELQTRIKKLLHGVELSLSPYDTAWVAMVPLRGSQTPYFPKCVDWILQNQQDDGSWSIDGSMGAVNKDILSSTLACVLALNKWNVGRETIRKGLDFIGKNFSIAMDEQTVAPIGFGITFPAMLNLAAGTGLEFPVRQTDIDLLTHLRDIKLERKTQQFQRSEKDSKEKHEVDLLNFLVKFPWIEAFQKAF